MAFSLIRGLMATVRFNIASIKRQAKRLQKASLEVFGQEYTLATCQTAIARSHGFQHLNEADRFLSRIGTDRTRAWWTIDHRTDQHEKCMEAIVTLGIELSSNKPIAFFGEARHAALPAYCLFAEEMSHRQAPGLILIETDQMAAQDTAIWPAVTALGHETWFNNFFSLDLRERTLPASVQASPKEWFKAVTGLVSYDEEQRWCSGDEAYVMEELFKREAHMNDGSHRTDFYPVEQAMYRILHLEGIRHTHLVRQDSDRDGGHFVTVAERCAKRGPSEIVQKMAALVGTTEGRNFRYGTSLVHESTRRPIVALFSREDPTSHLLANRLISLFRSGAGGRNGRPILYCADKHRESPPASLAAFPENTIFVPGEDGEKWAEWSKAGLGYTLNAYVGEADIVAAGKRYRL